MATKQILGGFPSGTTSSTTENYAPFLYGTTGGFSTTAVYRSDIVPTAGSLSGLMLFLSAAPGVGKSFTFTVMKNGVASDITITISGTDTTGSDLIHTLAVSAGDYITLRSTPSGSPTVADVETLIIWTPTIDGEYIFGGNSVNGLVGETYVSLSSLIYNATESLTTSVIPLSGTVKKLCLQAQSDPGAGKSIILTARKNGADQALVATVVAGATQNIDTVNSFSVAEGDLISSKISTTGGATNNRNSWAVVILPDDTTKVPVIGNHTSSLSNSATQYGRIAFNQTFGISGYYLRWLEGYNFSKMVVYLGTAPGEGKSRTITLRDDDADTGLAVTISETDQAGSVSAAVEPADLSLMNWKSVPTGTPAASLIRLGFVYSAISAGETTPPPTTLAPTTLAPTTLTPTTVAPTTILPSTLASTTLEPTTLDPTTVAPTSLAPTTLAPTTLLITTEGPTTSPPTTVVVTTLSPTTIFPTTLAPTSLAPTTLIPSTIAPSSLAPSTLQPSTQVPTTLSPTTLEPTTLSPTTLTTSTLLPTTLAPTTIGPTTLSPTTLFHSTVPPTTLVPTTQFPICPTYKDSIISDQLLISSIIQDALIANSLINDEVYVNSLMC